MNCGIRGMFLAKAGANHGGTSASDGAVGGGDLELRRNARRGCPAPCGELSVASQTSSESGLRVD